MSLIWGGARKYFLGKMSPMLPCVHNCLDNLRQELVEFQICDMIREVGWTLQHKTGVTTGPLKEEISMVFLFVFCFCFVLDFVFVFFHFMTQNKFISEHVYIQKKLKTKGIIFFLRKSLTIPLMTWTWFRQPHSYINWPLNGLQQRPSIIKTSNHKTPIFSHAIYNFRSGFEEMSKVVTSHLLVLIASD